MSLFRKPKYTVVKVSKRKGVPDGTWLKCEGCGEMIYKKTLDENFKVCPKCNYHFVLGAYERIDMFLDEGSFEEFDKGMKPRDILKFKGPKSYAEKIAKDTLITGMEEAIITGKGRVNNRQIALAVTDSRFIMGSMGYVVGEKVTRVTEYATENELPLVIVSGSGGGARMYEGMISLMQMAKTSAALAKHNEAGFLYISVLTNPTMAGVLASFASLGDVNIAEPKALIGFTGPRVIEQTIRQKLPEGFQTSEFLLEHGLIDMVVNRKNLSDTVVQLVDYMG
ncbi:MAG: acetyl-CoA carboxylase, carboxyltransferase subunit beta [Candidatus Omnitrophica bacterium]|nr:acetyl-CoA carboxylase, carboxyltransferase subunit beta [Candidatus Omnitrophota bacterium]MBU4590821.1 acetyl-CoA carboxylase, carboxyltransferase subunit beta [Candidatus Omnitrophota bacterium]